MSDNRPRTLREPEVYLHAGRLFRETLRREVCKKNNIASMLLMAHDFEELQWREMLVDGMGSDEIRLKPDMIRTLRTDYMRMEPRDAQIQAAYDKLVVQAKVEYLESALKCSKPLIENHNAKSLHEAGSYVIGLSNVSQDAIPTDVENVLMVFDGVLYGTDPFFVYEGYVHRRHDGIIVFFQPNDDYFNVDRDVVVSIFTKPAVKHLESHLHGIRALRNDAVVNGKLFPDPNQVDGPHLVLGWPGQTLNQLQLRTIAQCVSLNPAHPFVSFGTPGSGKSTTMAMLALWLHRTQKGMKILIVSQTNNACNVITQMLLDKGIPPEHIRRILARSYDHRTAPEFLRHVTFFDAQKEVYYVPKTDILLKGYEIYVSTIGSVLQLDPLDKNFFDYIIFEEAGQISELDVLIPCACFVSEKTKLIFAGDVQQLPPFTPSAALFELGYNIFPPTILRLSRLPIFQTNDRWMITLEDTYRAIPKLMGLYSEVSYRGRLVAHVAEDLTVGNDILGNNACLRWHLSTPGKERQDPTTMSYSNEFEVEEARKYVQRAIQSRVPPDEIGVITPYRAQVEAIRAALAYLPDFGRILVDTVEAFQGREKTVVIISLVRTERMGFLQDWRRMNTAITRVKKCLIIIGEPYNLVQANIGGVNNYYMRLFRQLKERDVFHDGIPVGWQLQRNTINGLYSIITPEYDMGDRDPSEVEDELLAEIL